MGEVGSKKQYTPLLCGDFLHPPGPFLWELPSSPDLFSRRLPPSPGPFLQKRKGRASSEAEQLQTHTSPFSSGEGVRGRGNLRRGGLGVR